MNTYKKDTTDNIRSVLGFFKAMSKQASIISMWCGWWDLNPHGSPRHPLKTNLRYTASNNIGNSFVILIAACSDENIGCAME